MEEEAAEDAAGRADNNGGHDHPCLPADDHEPVRELSPHPAEGDDEIEVIGEAATAEEAVSRIPLAKPDVAILDVRLEDGNGIEVRPVMSAR